jgi:predicted porin
MAWSNGYSNYPDPIRDQQQVVINGVQVFKPVGRWMVGGTIIDTRYLRTNLVNSFQTYAVTAGYRVTPTRTLRAALVAESGKGYHSIRGTLGSSWKF